MSVYRRGTKFIARAYVGGRHVHLGSFDTKHEAQRAHDDYKAQHTGASAVNVDAFASRWMDDYPRPKESTRAVNRDRAKHIAKDFKGAKLSGPLSRSAWAKQQGMGNQPDRVVARRWALENPSLLPAARAMWNDAVNDGLVGTNPFAKLNLPQSRGRKDITPPSPEEIDKLAECARQIHSDGGLFAAQIIFAAYTGVRPGELWELRWADLDLPNLELTVSRRVWNGQVDKPKNGRSRTIILPPPARDALLDAPRRTDTDLLFTTTRGRPFSQTSHRHYWVPVRAAAQLPHMDWYDMRHFCATYLLELGVSPADVALQMGHQDGGRLVQELYGHPSEQRARDRLKRAFQPPADLQAVRSRKERSA